MKTDAAGVFSSLPVAGSHDAEALHLLGASLHRQGRLEESAEALAKAARLAPQNPHYRISLAATLGRLGRHHEATGELVRALTLRGDIPELHNNLGVSLEELGRHQEAASALRNALKLRSDYLQARRNLGNVLRLLGRPDEAVAEYEAALNLRQDDVESLGGMCSAITELGDAARAVECCRQVIRLSPDSPSARSSMLYTIHYCPEYDAAALAEEHRQWGRLFCDPLKDRITPHDNDRSPERKLRVGYVSPDFREHTVPHFATAALEHHDPEQFDVFCYSDVEKPDAVTAKLKGMVEHWSETWSLGNEALARKIRDDSIDILVDLRGHAADNRLPMFCLKPAPVQVNMVGYFDTTGLSAMDYRITDDLQDPPGETERYHTETLARLPGSCWCYTADEDAPAVAEPPALKNGFITFGSLNKIIKVSEPCARLWARVLDAVNGSKLLLSVAGADAGGSVRKRLESYGIPCERLVITDKTRTRGEYLARFHEIDLALDTWPFNGITTTCDGLWMGVPCVSMTGKTSVSRAGKSILDAADLAELASETPEAFVQTATELAGNVDRLRELRMCMRDRLVSSGLMDHRGFARKLESAYRMMWRAWCGAGGLTCREQAAF